MDRIQQDTFIESHLAPIDSLAVFARMLRNLMHIYRQNQEVTKLLGTLNQIIEIQSDNNQEVITRMHIHVQLKDPKALQDLESIKDRLPEGVYQNYYALLKREINPDSPPEDEIIEEPKLRNAAVHKKVKYGVGFLMTHIKYGYRGVIFGWDPVCKATTDWIVHMGINNLTYGKEQPFYHVLVDTRDRPYQNTYVAQEYIKAMTNPQPILHLDVGKYFSEYDFQNNCYAPNEELKYTYPNS